MIKDDGYKLILRYPFQGVSFPHELYDLKADPRETVNLYEEPRYRKVIQQMTEQLKNYFSKYSEPAHDGLHLEAQPMTTPESPWLEALKQKTNR